MINPIVVIDSGMGGLSVLNSLTEILPKECYIYYADNANMPYGTKSQKQVIDISLVNLKAILNYKPKIIVIACNTMTACAVDTLRATTSIPIIGCEPAILPALRITNKRALVLTTSTTAVNEHFLMRFSGLDNYDILPLKMLAQMIEEDAPTTQLEEYLVSNITNIDKYDVIVLGCTHFVLIKDMFNKLFCNVQIIDGNNGIANQTRRILASTNICNKNSVCRSIFVTMTGSDSNAYARYIKYIK